jgi:hypothetical protein
VPQPLLLASKFSTDEIIVVGLLIWIGLAVWHMQRNRR